MVDYIYPLIGTLSNDLCILLSFPVGTIWGRNELFPFHFRFLLLHFFRGLEQMKPSSVRFGSWSWARCSWPGFFLEPLPFFAWNVNFHFRRAWKPSYSENRTSLWMNVPLDSVGSRIEWISYRVGILRTNKEEFVEQEPLHNQGSFMSITRHHLSYICKSKTSSWLFSLYEKVEEECLLILISVFILSQ